MATEKINVCEVYEEELGEDEPIEYEGLTFYPVKIKNMYKLMRSVDVLLYDNLNYPDDELAGLPRLSFLRQMILRAKTEQENLAAQVLQYCVSGFGDIQYRLSRAAEARRFLF